MLKDSYALVLIECQNEFCSTEGVLYNAVKDVLEKNNVLANIKTTLEAARGKCHIIHTPIKFSEGYPEIGPAPYGILKGVVDGNAFIQGSKGADFYHEFQPASKEIIAEGKKTLSAFSSSNLDTILRVNNIKTVFLAGFLTNVCIEATARSAYDLGYEVYVLSDCTAATSIEEQNFATEKMLPLFSKVITHNEFISLLSAENIEVETKQRAYYS